MYRMIAAILWWSEIFFVESLTSILSYRPERRRVTSRPAAFGSLGSNKYYRGLSWLKLPPEKTVGTGLKAKATMSVLPHLTGIKRSDQRQPFCAKNRHGAHCIDH